MFKKITALLLCAILLSSSINAAANVTAEIAVYPEEAVNDSGQVPSDAADKGLEAAVIRAKELFGDTSDYNSFNSYNDTNGNATTYTLMWSDSDKRGDLEIVVGSDGEIYYYSLYGESYDYDSKFVIPKITKQNALETALEFIDRISPDISVFFSGNMADVSYVRAGYYRITLYSQNAGYKIDDNTVSLNVSCDGNVTSFRRSQSNAIEKHATVTTADKSSLISAFKKASPMELAYAVDYPDSNGKKAEIKLVYRLSDDYNKRALNAETGDAYILSYTESYELTNSYNDVYNTSAYPEESTAQSAAFSEAEINNISLNKGFLSADEAFDQIKTITQFNIPDEAQLASSSLRSSKSIYTGKTTYFWQLNFECGEYFARAVVAAEKKPSDSSDATEDFVKSFVCYENAEYTLYSEVKNDESACRAAADAFIAEYYPDTAGEYVISDSNGITAYKQDDYISTFDFNYVRVVNGTKFENDYITVSVSPQELYVKNINYSHSDAAFPSLNGIIGADKAQALYWSAVPYELSYILYTTIEGDTVNAVYCDTSYAAKKLLLTLKYGDYIYIDAKSGIAATTSFDQYTPSAQEYYKESVFGDISDYKYREQIEFLYNMSIIAGGEQYSPDKTVTLNDFSTMLRACGLYGSYGCFDDADGKKLMSRSDALCIMVDALGYHDVASLEGIYKIPFDDADKITGRAAGHVSIAYALGLSDIFGSTLSPQSRLTRGEAAALVYNLLTVTNK